MTKVPLVGSCDWVNGTQSGHFVDYHKLALQTFETVSLCERERVRLGYRLQPGGTRVLLTSSSSIEVVCALSCEIFKGARGSQMGRERDWSARDIYIER